MSTPPSTHRPRLARAALLGLCGGLLIGAVTLGLWAFRSRQVDCAHLTPQECRFEQESAAQLGRLQAMSAIALGLLAAATLLALRARNKAENS